MKIYKQILLIIFIFASNAFGHSGGTDSNGGHHDRKGGGYHYHNSGYKSNLNTKISYKKVIQKLILHAKNRIKSVIRKNIMKRGIFVGRFQPIHKGHIGAIKNILKTVDELIIIVGSSQHSHTLINPFTTGERITMIKRAMKEVSIPLTKCWVIPVPDVHIHMLWVSQIVGYSPKFDIVYTNESLTRRLFIEAGFEVEPIPFIERNFYSASKIRDRILNGRNWEELVPKSVAHFIKKINGVARLQDLTKKDVAP